MFDQHPFLPLWFVFSERHAVPSVSFVSHLRLVKMIRKFIQKRAQMHFVWWNRRITWNMLLFIYLWQEMLLCVNYGSGYSDESTNVRNTDVVNDCKITECSPVARKECIQPFVAFPWNLLNRLFTVLTPLERNKNETK